MFRRIPRAFALAIVIFTAAGSFAHENTGGIKLQSQLEQLKRENRELRKQLRLAQALGGEADVRQAVVERYLSEAIHSLAGRPELVKLQELGGELAQVCPLVEQELEDQGLTPGSSSLRMRALEILVSCQGSECGTIERTLRGLGLVE
jgi:hypothetical protein